MRMGVRFLRMFMRAEARRDGIGEFIDVQPTHAKHAHKFEHAHFQPCERNKDEICVTT